MRKIQINVYKFDELSLTDQTAIIREYYNGVHIPDNLVDFVPFPSIDEKIDYQQLRKYVKENIAFFTLYYKDYEFWHYHSVFAEKDEYEVKFWFDFR